MRVQEARRRGPESGHLGQMTILLVPTVSISLSTLTLRPVRPAMTAVTEATPMMMPVVVSTDLVLLAQICPRASKTL